MRFDPSRRELLGGGLFLGALLLAGCQRQKKWSPLSKDQLDAPPHPLPSAPPPARPVAAADVSGVIPRREWTGSPPIMSLINPMNGVSRITVHHDGMPPVSLRSKSMVASRLELIRRAHITHNPPWADIGYHYIIDPEGRIWEGRPCRFQGAHVKMNNEHNLGIMVLGNFDEQSPTTEALATLDAFVADRMRAYRVPLHRVFTHQEINTTACPGRNLQSYMVATRGIKGRLARSISMA